jgi:diketogulonate reductase-like aldo/keto reductase
VEISGRKTLWKGLEKLKEQGKTRAIGVSNYGVKHLEEMKTYSSTPPAVNQIEVRSCFPLLSSLGPLDSEADALVILLQLHPFCQQRDIVEYCQKNNITLQVNAFASPIAPCVKLRSVRADRPSSSAPFS